jgi:hypothetical protein
MRYGTHRVARTMKEPTLAAGLGRAASLSYATKLVLRLEHSFFEINAAAPHGIGVPVLISS